MALKSLEQLEQDSGISRYTWRAWLRQRRLPFVKLGRSIVVDEADYHRFVTANRVAAREEAGR